MLSTGDAVRRKGTDTISQYFLTDREFSFAETAALFAEIAKNEHTTRFTINATDPRIAPPDGQKELRTLTNDPKIAARATFNMVYEDADEWLQDVQDTDVYSIAGAFDFDEQWTYISIEEDGTIKALFRKEHADILSVLTEAEAAVLAKA